MVPDAYENSATFSEIKNLMHTVLVYCMLWQQLMQVKQLKSRDALISTIFVTLCPIEKYYHLTKAYLY